MANPGLTKAFSSAAAIPAHTIVKFDTSDTSVAAAAAASDALIGVTTDIASSAGGECDVILDDIAYVILGGTVTRGDLLTSDASGHAITAAPAAGTNNRIIGMAMQSGVSGDIIDVRVSPNSFQG